MKFTNDQAFDELKRQLKKIVGEPAINDRTIKEHIENLMPLVANDETELNDFVTKILPMIKSIDGNYRKHDSDFAKKWEKEHPIVEPAVEEPKPSEAEAKLLERLEKLEKAENDRIAAAKLTTQKSLLSAKMKEKGIADEEWIETILSEVTISDEVDVDTKADTYLKLYNKGKATKVITPTPMPPSGSHEPKGTWDDIKAALARERGEK